jgi:hypothetical protein
MRQVRVQHTSYAADTPVSIVNAQPDKQRRASKAPCSFSLQIASALPLKPYAQHRPFAMAALETVTIQHPHAHRPKTVRISRNIRRAIDFMVYEGGNRAQGASAALITDDAVRKALKKPEVLAYMNTQIDLIRTSAAAKSIARIDVLAGGAESEHVKLGANELLLKLDGKGPIERSQHQHIHQHSIPGLQIIYSRDWTEPETALLIDGQAVEVESAKSDNGLPIPVPHPAMRNARK